MLAACNFDRELAAAVAAVPADHMWRGRSGHIGDYANGSRVGGIDPAAAEQSTILGNEHVGPPVHLLQVRPCV